MTTDPLALYTGAVAAVGDACRDGILTPAEADVLLRALTAALVARQLAAIPAA